MLASLACITLARKLTRALGSYDLNCMTELITRRLMLRLTDDSDSELLARLLERDTVTTYIGRLAVRRRNVASPPKHASACSSGRLSLSR